MHVRNSINKPQDFRESDMITITEFGTSLVLLLLSLFLTGILKATGYFSP